MAMLTQSFVDLRANFEDYLKVFQGAPQGKALKEICPNFNLKQELHDLVIPINPFVSEDDKIRLQKFSDMVCKGAQDHAGLVRICLSRPPESNSTTKDPDLIQNLHSAILIHCLVLLLDHASDCSMQHFEISEQCKQVCADILNCSIQTELDIEFSLVRIDPSLRNKATARKMLGQANQCVIALKDELSTLQSKCLDLSLIHI